VKCQRPHEIKSNGLEGQAATSDEGQFLKGGTIAVGLSAGFPTFMSRTTLRFFVTA
jgi:hypothetical protein